MHSIEIPRTVAINILQSDENISVGVPFITVFALLLSILPLEPAFPERVRVAVVERPAVRQIAEDPAVARLLGILGVGRVRRAPIRRAC